MDTETPMNTLTKKYIFECKLAGKPIDISDCLGPARWSRTMKMLIECEILTEDHSTPKPWDVKFLKEPKAGAYYLHYPIQAKYRENDDPEWTISTITPRRILMKP